MTDIMRLVCTLKVLQTLLVLREYMILKERPADLCQQLKHTLEKFVTEEDPDDSVLPRSGQEIVDALQYCISIIREHPLVFSQLELGHTWKNILVNIRVNVPQNHQRLI